MSGPGIAGKAFREVPLLRMTVVKELFDLSEAEYAHQRSPCGMVREDADFDDFCSDVVTLAVGDDEHQAIFLVYKHLLTKFPYFQRALKNDFFEGSQNMIVLPEDDVSLWLAAIEYFRVGEFSPRLIVGEQCIDDGSRLRHEEQDYCYNEAYRPQRHDRPCMALHTPIKVLDGCGKERAFEHDDIRLGDWAVPNDTQLLFDTLVELFWMADKYCLDELTNLCLQKIKLFPIGPAAFNTLVQNCDELLSLSVDNDGAAKDFQALVHDAVEYHGVAYDESKTDVYQYGRENETVARYDGFETFMKENMTSEAWTVYQLMTESRVNKIESLRSRRNPGWWTHEQERQGLCMGHWTATKATKSWKAYMKRTGQPSPEEALRNSEKGSNLFLGYSFAEAELGDLITEIIYDEPAVGYVYGFVERTSRYGWFEKEMIRFLEKRSRKHCTGECCELPSFKYDGVRLYLHDVHSEGIKVRPGRKSKGWRRHGGPKMFDHTRTVASLRKGDNRGWSSEPEPTDAGIQTVVQALEESPGDKAETEEETVASWSSWIWTRLRLNWLTW